MSSGIRRSTALAITAVAFLALASCGRKEQVASREPQRQPAPHAGLRPEDVTAELQDLAYSMVGEVVPARPHRPGGPSALNGEPEHVRFHFDDDSLSKSVDYRERQLLVYDLEAYRQIFQGAELDSFNRRMKGFAALLDSAPVRVEEEIPTLPFREGRQLFRVQADYLALDGGLGVRFVSRQAADKSPTTNRTIFYTFQGLVGKYYIAFYWPITARELPEWTDPARSARYLGGLTSAELTPNPGVLDRLVESIRIHAQAAAGPGP